MTAVAVGPGRVYLSSGALADRDGSDLLKAINGMMPAAWRAAVETAPSPVLAYRRRCAARAWRAAPAGRSRCAHCFMPWGDGNRAPRWVGYRTSCGAALGLFVVCRWCWANSTALQRFAYAYEAVFKVWPRGGVPVERCIQDWPAIAVAYGGVPDTQAPFGYAPPEGAGSS
jgi:hypothetical protein